MEKKIFKVAHRGASGYEPENTMAAFQKALDLGVDMIELDVYVCKTGEVMVIHDDTVDRTTSGSGKVEEKTFTELKSLNVPGLTEVLDLVDKKANINIELKGKNTVFPVRAVIEQYVEKEGWNYDNFIVSSFNHKLLSEFKKVLPEVKIGVLSAELLPGVPGFAKKIGAYSVNAPADKISHNFVDKVHSLGMKMFVYAADQDHEIESSKLLGADYICSNYPDKI